jgi:hypothetical protein
MKLTENFTLAEVTKSGTANKLGISNMPNKEDMKRLRVLCEQVLQPLRNHFGPIRITSGYRSERLNKEVGGVSTSQHIKGEAVDIIPIEADIDEVFLYICHNMDIDQVILEESKGSRWIHVSYVGEKNREEAMLFNEGKYKMI